MAGLITMIAIWGYNWVVMKVALADSGPFEFIATRTVLSSVLLFGVLALLRRPLTTKAWGWVALTGVLLAGGQTLLSVLALSGGGDVRRTIILVFTMPFWTVLFARLILHERIRPAHWVGLALGAAGLAIFLDPVNAGARDVRSELYAIGSGFAWALGSVIAKYTREKHRLDVLSMTAWQVACASIPLVAFAVFAHERPIAYTTSYVLALLFNIVLAGAMAWLLWLFVLARLPAITAAMGSLGIPVVGVLAAWAQFHERPAPLEMVAMGLIAAALVVVTVAGGSPAHGAKRDTHVAA